MVFELREMQGGGNPAPIPEWKLIVAHGTVTKKIISFGLLGLFFFFSV